MTDDLIPLVRLVTLCPRCSETMTTWPDHSALFGAARGCDVCLGRIIEFVRHEVTKGSNAND